LSFSFIFRAAKIHLFSEKLKGLWGNKKSRKNGFDFV
tara:strand:- start:7623 stop:7733 length:111 start_codon:yes stop_codon:yes gene_type:complete